MNNAKIEQCDSVHFHMEHYYNGNKSWCIGVYRELSDAVKAWNKLYQDLHNA